MNVKHDNIVEDGGKTNKGQTTEGQSDKCDHQVYIGVTQSYCIIDNQQDIAIIGTYKLLKIKLWIHIYQ